MALALLLLSPCLGLRPEVACLTSCAVTIWCIHTPAHPPLDMPCSTIYVMWWTLGTVWKPLLHVLCWSLFYATVPCIYKGASKSSRKMEAKFILVWKPFCNPHGFYTIFSMNLNIFYIVFSINLKTPHLYWVVLLFILYFIVGGFGVWLISELFTGRAGAFDISALTPPAADMHSTLTDS